MTIPRRAGRAGALSRDDWIRAAAQALAEHGVGAVAVEPLAKRLGVTKGSFYWHFPNRDALLIATLERWEQEHTEAVITRLNQLADPRRQLVQLISLAFTDEAEPVGTSTATVAFDNAFDLAVADASADPTVQPIFRRVSERRVDYLVECFRALGCPPDEARYRGLLAYATYVGTLRLAREAPGRFPRGDAFEIYLRHVIAATLPDRQSVVPDTRDMAGEIALGHDGADCPAIGPGERKSPQ